MQSLFLYQGLKHSFILTLKQFLPQGILCCRRDPCYKSKISGRDPDKYMKTQRYLMLKYTKCVFQDQMPEKGRKQSEPTLKVGNTIQQQRHQIDRGGKCLFPNTVNQANLPKANVIFARPQLLTKVKYSLQQICRMYNNILLILTNKQTKKYHVQIQHKQVQKDFTPFRDESTQKNQTFPSHWQNKGPISHSDRRGYIIFQK